MPRRTGTLTWPAGLHSHPDPRLLRHLQSCVRLLQESADPAAAYGLHATPAAGAPGADEIPGGGSLPIRKSCRGRSVAGVRRGPDYAGAAEEGRIPVTRCMGVARNCHLGAPVVSRSVGHLCRSRWQMHGSIHLTMEYPKFDFMLHSCWRWWLNLRRLSEGELSWLCGWIQEDYWMENRIGV